MKWHTFIDQVLLSKDEFAFLEKVAQHEEGLNAFVHAEAGVDLLEWDNLAGKLISNDLIYSDYLTVLRLTERGKTFLSEATEV